jgi:hypothetical protein
MALNIDFARGAAVDQLAAEDTEAAVWDASNWDEVAWPQIITTLTEWSVTEGLGTWASARMSGAVSDDLADLPGQPLTLQVNGFQVQFLPGGLL